jgi:hypothetical protein
MSGTAGAALVEAMERLRAQIVESDEGLARMDIAAVADGLAREGELVDLIRHLAGPRQRARLAADDAVRGAARELHLAAVRHLELIAGARRVVEGVVRRLAATRAAAGSAALAVDRRI